MTTTTLEQIPTTWTDSRDVPFFRIVARLFTGDVVFAAGVLLEGNSEQECASRPALVSAS